MVLDPTLTPAEAYILGFHEWGHLMHAYEIKDYAFYKNTPVPILLGDGPAFAEGVAMTMERLAYMPEVYKRAGVKVDAGLEKALKDMRLIEEFWSIFTTRTALFDSTMVAEGVYGDATFTNPTLLASRITESMPLIHDEAINFEPGFAMLLPHLIEEPGYYASYHAGKLIADRFWAWLETKHGSANLRGRNFGQLFIDNLLGDPIVHYTQRLADILES